MMPPCHLDLHMTSISTETTTYVSVAIPHSQNQASPGTDEAHTTRIVLTKEICSEELVISIKPHKQEIGDPELKPGIYGSKVDDHYSTSHKSVQQRMPGK